MYAYTEPGDQPLCVGTANILIYSGQPLNTMSQVPITQFIHTILFASLSGTMPPKLNETKRDDIILMYKYFKRLQVQYRHKIFGNILSSPVKSNAMSQN